MASQISHSLVRQHETKAFMERSAIRLSFLFFMSIATFIVVHRLLWFISPAIYITRPFIQLIQLFAYVIEIMLSPLIKLVSPTIEMVIPGLSSTFTSKG